MHFQLRVLLCNILGGSGLGKNQVDIVKNCYILH
jgi:hypothetical protein